MTGNLEQFISLKNVIKEWLEVHDKSSGISTPFCTDIAIINCQYNILSKRVSRYLYNIDEQKVNNAFSFSFNKLTELFNLSSGGETESFTRLDISDLFLILEIIDIEFSITNTTTGYCILEKNSINGKFEAVSTGKEFVYNISSIAELIEYIISKFNSFNIYLCSKNLKITSDNTLEKSFLSCFVGTSEIYRKKPDAVTNKLQLEQIEKEQKVSEERFWEIMVFSKMIGMVRTLFILDNNKKSRIFEELDKSDNSSLACISLLLNVVDTLNIFQKFNKLRNRVGTVIFLQCELHEIICNLFPYDLVNSLERVCYWNYFQDYLYLNLNIQNLIFTEISYEIEEMGNILNNVSFNKVLNLIDFIFNRLFLMVNSIETKYYSNDNKDNYTSSFCVLIANHFLTFLIIEDKDEKYYYLIRTVLEINIINWTKLSFLCVNNIYNLCHDSLMINPNSIIPKDISMVNYFKNTSINGYSMILFGLKMLYQLLYLSEAKIFLPLVDQIFRNIRTTHRLFSQQDQRELSSVSLNNYQRVKRLLEEITILFSQRLDSSILGILLSREDNEKTNYSKDAIKPLINLMENSCYLI
ncbi:hypothetical protein HWI79_1081 [Cryptosporidium felis]|nr:hypothetical protein HWI79_1081 [Cryptosporidium felis]